jgi:hypothetical protein
MLKKVCPKCGRYGQIFIENDVVGKAEVCLSCGSRVDINRTPALTGAQRNTKYG